MLTQYNHLAAILTAGLSKKIIPGTDLTKADWAILEPFLAEQGLMCIADSAFKHLQKNDVALPGRSQCVKITCAAMSQQLERAKHQADLALLSAEWRAEGKCVLILGGEAFAPFYPKATMRGGDDLLCVPVYKDKEPEAPLEGQDFTYRSLRVAIPAAAEVPFSGKRGKEQDAVLARCFFATPCSLDAKTGMAYPNPAFCALYHLYLSQHQVLHSRLPFRSVLDWAVLLRLLSQLKAEKFDWAVFLEYVADLGLMPFAKIMTELAVRLTGVDRPEACAVLTATDEDVDYLLQCIFGEEVEESASQGRLSRFMGVLHNSKKYSVFTDLQPRKEAFRHLFG